MPLPIASAISTGSIPSLRAAGKPSGAITRPASGEPIAAMPAVRTKKTRGRATAFLPTPPSRPFDHPIDRAVHAGDGEEVGDARQEDHDADGEAADDVAKRHAREPDTDAAAGGEHHDAEMHAAERGDGEDGDEDAHRGQLSGHCSGVGESLSREWLRPMLSTRSCDGSLGRMRSVKARRVIPR
jgi:hypothetical protein